MGIIAYMLFGLGGFFCLLNFYLSFLRYPIYRLLGGTKKEYKWVSGAPLLGSLFVGIGLISHYEIKWMLILGLALILIDTGGPHWFLATMFYYAVFRKKRISKNPMDENDSSRADWVRYILSFIMVEHTSPRPDVCVGRYLKMSVIMIWEWYPLYGQVNLVLQITAVQDN